jgi:hypothetical protein
MSSLSYPQETNSKIHHISLNSIASDDDDDDDDSNDQSNESIDKSNNKKKTLGRVKIETAYIENKIRRYTTFSKRKAGIMKKAYELATLTGTEVMLLVASETGHVYTYATPKLQPMITSEAGKTLIQTCLAKDESIIEPPSIPTILNNNDVILSDTKKRTNLSEDGKIFFLLFIHLFMIKIGDISRPSKHAKLKSSDEIKQLYPTTTTVAVPLSYLVNQQSPIDSSSFTIDLNSLKNNGTNIVLTPSDTPLVLTLGSHFPYQLS